MVVMVVVTLIHTEVMVEMLMVLNHMVVERKRGEI